MSTRVRWVQLPAAKAHAVTSSSTVKARCGQLLPAELVPAEPRARHCARCTRQLGHDAGPLELEPAPRPVGRPGCPYCAGQGWLPTNDHPRPCPSLLCEDVTL